MSELFRVHLLSHDITPTTKLNTNTKQTIIKADINIKTLIHIDINIHERGTIYENTDNNNNNNLDKISTSLLSNLYCAATNIFNEIEEKNTFNIANNNNNNNNNNSHIPLHHIHLNGGARLFLMNSIENLNYMLAITIPLTLWRWLGEILIQILLATSINGYEIPIQVAAITSVPTYFTLNNRLHENIKAVEESIRERMQEIVEFIILLNSYEKSEEIMKKTVMIIIFKKLCVERPSPIRIHKQLYLTFQQLIWSATNISDYTSLTGGISTVGICEGFKKLIITGAAIWYNGEALFCNSSSNNFENHLLPVAIMSYTSHCLNNNNNNNNNKESISVKCFAMHSNKSKDNDSTSTFGYIKQHLESIDNEAIICVSFVSLNGWIIVLQLETALNSFTGSPMSHITSGIINLITKTLETPRFHSLIQQLTTSTLIQSRATVSGISSITFHIMQGLYHFGIFERTCSSYYCYNNNNNNNNITHTTTITRDTCLYRYYPSVNNNNNNNNNSLVMCTGSFPWPSHINIAALRLIELAMLALRQQQQLSFYNSVNNNSNNNNNNLFRNSLFSLLRGKDSVVILQALPVWDSKPHVLLFIGEINIKDLPSASELRSFATWVLSKVI